MGDVEEMQVVFIEWADNTLDWPGHCMVPFFCNDRISGVEKPCLVAAFR